MLTSVQFMNTEKLLTTSSEIDLRALQHLERSPEVNQRELAQVLGVSLGKANYCIKALLAKGLIKANNFKNSNNKWAYAYVLTPAGIAARAELTVEFLQVKLHEYEKLSHENSLPLAPCPLVCPSNSPVQTRRTGAHGGVWWNF